MSSLGDGRFVPAEEVIAAHLHTLFVGMIVEEWAMFRVTRNADLTLEEDEADDLLEAVELELRRRRFNKAIRLEVADIIGDELLDLLVRELELDLRNVSRHRAMIDLSCLMQLHVARPPRPQGPCLAARHGRPPAPVAEETGRSIFSVIRDRALLVHHPYESFASSVEEFIEQAADRPPRAVDQDDAVPRRWRQRDHPQPDPAPPRAASRWPCWSSSRPVSTRPPTCSGHASSSVPACTWSTAWSGLKTHSKVVLVVRDDGDQLRRYCHIGTGNYNSKTARLYEDLGFLTCDNDIGADVAQLFNHLTGYSRSDEYRTLLVAPRDLKSQLIDLIEHEASFGTEGRITFKCNSIADRAMIDVAVRGERRGHPDRRASSAASARCGPACPASPTTSGCAASSVATSSTAGSTGSGTAIRSDGDADGPMYLIGSADLMPRNLDRRVEVLVPIDHPKHREWLDQVLEFDARRRHRALGAAARQQWIRLGPTRPFEPDRPGAACTAGRSNASSIAAGAVADGRRLLR